MNKSLPILLLVLVLVTACGGNQAAAPTPLPSPTPIPTYQYITVTPVAQIATLAANENAPAAQTEQAAALDPAAVTAGEGRYVALICGSCHGDAGQGGGDQGPALLPVKLNEIDFITLLRSGGKLGSKHQYATNRLSDKGAHNLYVYLESLGS